MHNSFGQVKMQFPVNNADVQKLPFYIFNIGSMEYQHPCYRPVGLVDYQFLYCTSGSGHLIVEDNTLDFVQWTWRGYDSFYYFIR